MGVPMVGRSRDRGENRAAVALASITAMLYVIAGAATAAQSGGWAAAAVLAASVGLVLKTLWSTTGCRWACCSTRESSPRWG